MKNSERSEVNEGLMRPNIVALLIYLQKIEILTPKQIIKVEILINTMNGIERISSLNNY